MNTLRLVFHEACRGLIDELEEMYRKNNDMLNLNLGASSSGEKLILQLTWEKNREHDVIVELVDTLYRCITGRLKLVFIEDILKKNGGILSLEEREEIMNRIKNGAAEEPEAPEVKKELIDYLHEGRSYLDLDGFARFRLINYLQNIERMVYSYIGDYLEERRRYTYLGILRMQLEMRSSRVEVIHMDVDSAGDLYLSDEISAGTRRMTPFQFWRKKEKEFQETVVNVLVSLAPRKLVLHRNMIYLLHLSSTLESVFKERIVFCKECSCCRGYTPELHPEY